MKLPSRGFWLLLAGLAALTTLPYVYAWAAAGPDHVFGGFLFNPNDQNSYLAKMYQGWQGDWRFHLPYTSEAGEGAYINLFYLFLGHIARWLGLPLIIVYHLARLIGVAVMYWNIVRFFDATIQSPRPRRLAIALAVFGSGMGWLAVMFGLFTSDFWVAEAYPFLSAYSNPHFSLGLGLILWLLTPKVDGENIRVAITVFFAALALALVSPFGVVVVGVVWVGWIALSAGRDALAAPERDIKRATPSSLVARWVTHLVARKLDLARLAALVLGGGPVLIYDLWVTYTDPVLAGWNAQNLTSSPPVWDLLLSFSPLFLLAIPGAISALVNGSRNTDKLIAWAVLGLALIYLPVGLQRRFIMGLYIPIAGLAALGLERLAAQRPRLYRWLLAGTIFLILPTQLLILMSGLFGARSHDPMLYLSRAEYQAFEWIAAKSPPSALILAAPDTGLFIPAYTGRRVLYGHPFETVRASEYETLVQSFYESPRVENIPSGVDFIFSGPREAAIAGKPIEFDLPIVYQNNDVTIYQAAP